MNKSMEFVGRVTEIATRVGFSENIESKETPGQFRRQRDAWDLWKPMVAVRGN